MIRTQISLEKKDYQAAKKAARVKGISLAEFVRRAVSDALPENKPWMKYAGDVDSGDPNASDSDSIDEIVYGHRP
jgi:hypothetical protein